MSSSLSSKNKIFTVAKTGHKYAYVHHPPSNPNKPTLLLLHGFPSTSYDWRHQIPFLTTLGYGVIVPDLLGYGSSSKPLDVEPYIGQSMAADMISVLDHEGINSIVGVGHDWGTYLLTHLILWYPERVERCVFVSVAFHVPGRKMDVQALNEMTRNAVGYEALGYWLFFTAPGSGKVIGDNWETFFNIIYCADASLWEKHFAPLGAMEKDLRDMTPEASSKFLASWICEEDKATHHAEFGTDYTPALNWYRRGFSSLGSNIEASALANNSISPKIHVPTLMITGTKDIVCIHGRPTTTMEGCVEEGRLEVKDIDAGHWVMLEKTAEFNKVLKEWLEDTEGKVGEKAGL
ncbi:Alpha/Beta hydrolase protein [Dactylonectria estremocensis]|uniref:Alpha/Beta hydrolase protein n=1 Tax=Dactylonectria estremocensis TaxID=1079267 RepID=A0A9P9FJF2_9HYPO|nr:Alpha/Beta hydrolase protein [Dactylonectria estremocensis]